MKRLRMRERKGCASKGGSREPAAAVSAELTLRDRLGALKVRLGIGRMNYTVAPGLYALGAPDDGSPVLVSANYKLTFDTLRRNLTGLDCWLLILDTKGINVWCAAGKGTFGTEELLRRMEASALSGHVSHRTLILPQLGAVGVSAHEVTRRSGYRVVYGPVRAEDIKAFLAASCKATRAMRTVQFKLRDRLVLTPMELIPAVQKSLPALGVLFLTNRYAKAFDRHDLTAYAGALAAGTVATPVLLPYLPGRAFAWKGVLTGLGWTAAYLLHKKRFQRGTRLKSAGELLLLPALSSYFAMNFTGSSTYTSPSGVNREMRQALPLIAGAAAVGGGLLGAHLLREIRHGAKRPTKQGGS